MTGQLRFAAADCPTNGERQHWASRLLRAWLRCRSGRRYVWPSWARQAYIASRPPAQTSRDLTGHDCINIRFLTDGDIYAGEFEKDGNPLNVRVDGRFASNNVRQIHYATLDGLGLACLPDDIVHDDIAAGRLQRLLLDGYPSFSGYHLYHPSRRHHSPAFSLLVEALHYH